MSELRDRLQREGKLTALNACDSHCNRNRSRSRKSICNCVVFLLLQTPRRPPFIPLFPRGHWAVATGLRARWRWRWRRRRCPHPTWRRQQQHARGACRRPTADAVRSFVVAVWAPHSVGVTVNERTNERTNERRKVVGAVRWKEGTNDGRKDRVVCVSCHAAAHAAGLQCG